MGLSRAYKIRDIGRLRYLTSLLENSFRNKGLLCLPKLKLWSAPTSVSRDVFIPLVLFYLLRDKCGELKAEERTWSSILGL